ncbi:hypothetical protein EDC01DRAFT_763819, partial [Geopyxis carbonaria]
QLRPPHDHSTSTHRTHRTHRTGWVLASSCSTPAPSKRVSLVPSTSRPIHLASHPPPPHHQQLPPPHSTTMGTSSPPPDPFVKTEAKVLELIDSIRAIKSHYESRPPPASATSSSSATITTLTQRISTLESESALHKLELSVERDATRDAQAALHRARVEAAAAATRHEMEMEALRKERGTREELARVRADLKMEIGALNREVREKERECEGLRKALAVAKEQGKGMGSGGMGSGGMGMGGMGGMGEVWAEIEKLKAKAKDGAGNGSGGGEGGREKEKKPPVAKKRRSEGGQGMRAYVEDGD